LLNTTAKLFQLSPA
jgi:hypothetical protein